MRRTEHIAELLIRLETAAGTWNRTRTAADAAECAVLADQLADLSDRWRPTAQQWQHIADQLANHTDHDTA